MFTFSSRMQKRLFFQAWRLLVTTIQLCAMEGQLQRLEGTSQRRANSIWQANKEELVEIAYRELPDATRDRLQKMTVVELRERVRAERSRQRLREAQDADPMLKLPTGLDRLKKEELETECLHRGLHVPAPTTRAKMIVAIKDDVEQRSQSTATAMGQDQQMEEWELTITNSSSSRPSRSRTGC